MIMKYKKELIKKGNRLFYQIQDLIKKINASTNKVEVLQLESDLKRLQKEFNRIFDIVFQ